jgi:hypothetical protein
VTVGRLVTLPASPNVRDESPNNGPPCLGAILAFGLLLSICQLSILAFGRLLKACARREGRISFGIVGDDGANLLIVQ